MAVPKKKVSKSRRGNRRSHDSLNFRTVVECPNCGAEKLPHQVCPSCGFYNKKEVVRKTEEIDEEELKADN